MRTVYEFSVKDRKGKDVSLKEYANEVLLIVNTAIKCGFTPQYEELEKLYEKYHAQGFEVHDFPCNQFGAQAPGTDESIHQFCKLTYNTEFPRFKKVKVNGDDADDLFKFLKEQKSFAGFDPSWTYRIPPLRRPSCAVWRTADFGKCRAHERLIRHFRFAVLLRSKKRPRESRPLPRPGIRHSPRIRGCAIPG